MGRLLGALWTVCCGGVCLLSAQEAGPPAAPDSVLVEIHAEMMIVGKEGSHRGGSERAVLPPGKVGLLRTSATLPRGSPDPQEEVSVALRVHARQTSEGLRLVLDSRAQGHPSGQLVERSGGGILSGTSPVFHEAYVSRVTGERVVFLVSARPWEDLPAGRVTTRPSTPRPVAYALRIYRLTDEGPELLDSPSLASLVGHSAGYSFGFSLESPEGGERREELQIRLRAVELRDGWLTGILSLEGEVGGSPVSRSRGWSLPSGGEAEIDLRLGGGEDGDVGFRIRVDVRF